MYWNIRITHNVRELSIKHLINQVDSKRFHPPKRTIALLSNIQSWNQEYTPQYIDSDVDASKDERRECRISVFRRFLDFTKIFTVAWHILRQSWFCPQNGEVAQWVIIYKGIIDQNKITTKHNKVRTLQFFIVITMYRWTVSQIYFSNNSGCIYCSICLLKSVQPVRKDSWRAWLRNIFVTQDYIQYLVKYHFHKPGVPFMSYLLTSILMQRCIWALHLL